MDSVALTIYYIASTVIAVLVIGGNIIAFLFQRAELHGQRKETRELAELTSKLQQDVERLSRDLDQSIARLHRVNDLITRTYFALNTATAKAVLDRRMGNEELKLLRTGVDVPLVELQALGEVIGDSRLNELISSLWDLTRGDKLDITGHDAWGKYLSNLDHTVTDLHKRVYQLLQAATTTTPQ